MKWYLQAFRNAFDFKGRARRSEYWYFFLFNLLVIFGLALIANIADEVGHDNYKTIDKLLLILFSGYLFVICIPILSVTVRRLHDTGRSGWFILLQLIPYIGGVILLIFTIQDSEKGTNKWGVNPKEMKHEDIMDHLVDDFD